MLRFALILPLLLAACPKDETISGYADPEKVFTLDLIDDRPFPARATISFPAEGVVRGEAPCNGWAAEQTAPYPWFELSPIRSTRRACDQLVQETEFFAALSEMTLAEVLGDVLILSNDAGREMVFRAGKS